MPCPPIAVSGAHTNQALAPVVQPPRAPQERVRAAPTATGVINRGNTELRNGTVSAPVKLFVANPRKLLFGGLKSAPKPGIRNQSPNQPAVVFDFLTAGCTSGVTVEGRPSRRQVLSTKVRRNSELESVLALEKPGKGALLPLMRSFVPRGQCAPSTCTSWTVSGRVSLG